MRDKEIRKLLKRVEKMGSGEDKILAHINPDEARLLAEISGYDFNSRTGLPQFGFFRSIERKFRGPLKNLIKSSPKILAAFAIGGPSAAALAAGGSLLGSKSSLGGMSEEGGEQQYPSITINPGETPEDFIPNTPFSNLLMGGLNRKNSFASGGRMYTGNGGEKSGSEGRTIHDILKGKLFEGRLGGDNEYDEYDFLLEPNKNKNKKKNNKNSKIDWLSQYL